MVKRNNTLTLDRIRRVCKKKRKEEEKKENKGYNRGMCHGKRVEDLQKGKVGDENREVFMARYNSWVLLKLPLENGLRWLPYEICRNFQLP